MDLTPLLNWLNSSKIQATNNSLYQVIRSLIDQTNTNNSDITAIKTGGSSGGFLTLLAGTLAGRRSTSNGTAEQITVDASLDITGTVLSLKDTGVTPATYGDVTHVPQIAVDVDGRITSASNIAIAAGTVTTTGSPVSGNLTKFSGANSITNGDLSGDVSTSGTLVVTIGANKVTDTMLRQSGALSIIGRSANSTGNVADISSSANEQILGRRSSVVGWNLIQDFGYWSPLTNGDPVTPELVFDSFGDVIAVWTAL